MKLYTAEYDADRPSTKSVEVPLNSTFGVAVGVKYDGEDVKLKQNEILLDGTLSASDVIDDKYLVFRLSSDGEAGYDRYSVASKTDGIDVVDGAAYAETPILPNPAYTTLICDLSHLAGKEWQKPVITTDEEMLLAPFNLRVYNSEGEMQSATGNPDIYIFIDDDGTPGASDAPYWKMKYKKTGSQYRVTWQKLNEAHTAWENTDEPLVIPKNAYVQATYAFAVVLDTGKIVFDIQHHQMLKRQFQLYVKKTDKGEIEGYGENYVFKNTVSLSGTYADDSEFSFEVPVVEG